MIIVELMMIMKYDNTILYIITMIQPSDRLHGGWWEHRLACEILPMQENDPLKLSATPPPPPPPSQATLVTLESSLTNIPSDFQAHNSVRKCYECGSGQENG